MRVLKIKAYQLFANYRKPLSYNFWDTYPLPPFSTVKGWFHKVIRAENYIPISICIQGEIGSVIYELQTLIKFDRVRKERENQLILKGFNKAFSRSPTFVANVFDVYLNIYFVSDEDNMKKFKENILEEEYPFLGRYEDLIRIDYIDFVDVIERSFCTFNSYTINYGTYLKLETARALNIEGIHYRMPFKYNLVKDLRYFSRIDVVYTDNSIIDKGKFWFDQGENRLLEFVGDYI